MPDSISKEKRSWNMRQIKSKDTIPELRIRSALHKLGFRYRIHYSKLPGKPDIVLPRYKTAIFIHGCFWHRHKNCIEASRPKTNSGYWENKIHLNIQRDKKYQSLLKKMGWRVVIIWECKVSEDINKNSTLLTSLLKKAKFYG